MVKLGVVGSHSFATEDNYTLIKNVLNKISNIKLIVSGRARCADTLAEQYANRYFIRNGHYMERMLH